MTEEEKLAEQAARDAGISMPDSSPMGIIDMEGRFFRGVSDGHRSPIVRTASIVFGFLFLIPGLLIIGGVLYGTIFEYVHGNVHMGDFKFEDIDFLGWAQFLMVIFWGALLLGGGLVTIVRNLHSPKK